MKCTCGREVKTHPASECLDVLFMKHVMKWFRRRRMYLGNRQWVWFKLKESGEPVETERLEQEDNGRPKKKGAVEGKHSNGRRYQPAQVKYTEENGRY